MEKEFVNYDLSLRMKQLGYKKEGVDEDCFAFYDEEEYLFTVREQDDIDEEWLIAPTFSQVFRWFREKYGIFVSIVPNKYGSLDSFIGWIYIPLNGSTKDIDVGGRKGYNTPEEAELACLEKLIEIVEQKEK
jgi:hypothetical protein